MMEKIIEKRKYLRQKVRELGMDSRDPPSTAVFVSRR